MEKSGFFNSSGGDRTYNAADFAAYFSNLVTNGIFPHLPGNLQVLSDTGMRLKVLPGSAWINGYSYQNTSDLELTLEISNGIHPRIDRVVLRWSATDRNIKLAVRTGSASATPTAPALTRTTDEYELGLADIAVAKGAVTITVNDITDIRLNTNVCGTVNSLISAVYE